MSEMQGVQDIPGGLADCARACLNAEYRRRWLALTGTVMVEAAWGMTETHPCDTVTTGMQEGGRDLAQPIFVGLPVPGTEVRIVAALPMTATGKVRKKELALLA